MDPRYRLTELDKAKRLNVDFSLTIIHAQTYAQEKLLLAEKATLCHGIGRAWESNMDANSFTNSSREDSATGRRAEDRGKTFIKRGADRRAPLETPYAAPFPLALFSCSPAGAVIGYNEAAAGLWGRHPHQSQTEQWCGALDLLDTHGAPMARSDYPAARAFRTGEDIVGVKAIIVRPDGSQRRVVAYAKNTLNADGSVRGVLCALIDHTERDALVDAVNRAEDEKNAFIAMLSHELRNPLSPILSAAIVMKKVSKDTQLSKMADIVERQAKRLARFVTDLLHAANLAQGGVTLNVKQASLRDVMQDAVDSLMALAEPRGQKVAIEPWPDTALMCDPERVSQALGNVMANASEFTGRDGRIVAKVHVEGAMLQIEISDNGIGIHPDHIAEIFKPYTHFATHADRTRAGAGLGLALAKDICEKHGGMIEAASGGEGCGSLFTLSLPIVVMEKPTS
jgi:signal transduction histidine kinase